MAHTHTSILDERARAVVEPLHARSRRQLLRGIPWAARAMLAERVRGGHRDISERPDGAAWLADKLVALDPAKAALCSVLCRSLQARHVVEIGTSFGVSTVYLASAVRDTIAAHGGTGEVIGTELEPTKAARARHTVDAAGVGDVVRILEGDLRTTLPELSGPVDFALIDIWIPMARPALDLLLPRLRTGALVVCDNVVSGRRQYADYLALVRDPAGPFESVTLPGGGGLEISRRRD